MAACSRQTVHQVLVFLYDGVPPLDADAGDLAADVSEAPTAIEGDKTPRRVRPGKTFYNHTPYWENRCGACHEGGGARLLKSARQGLCQSCHHKNLEKKEYVHGPVAVSGCLACHTYHRSVYPKLLIADAQTICFDCHAMNELTTDRHHATIETERCIDCHDSHGGDERFYLLPGAVTGDSP